MKPKSDAVLTFQKNQDAISAHNRRTNETYKRKLQSHSDLNLDEKRVYRMGFNDMLMLDANLTVPNITRKTSNRGKRKV